MLWGYVNFSQFLIIWSGNISEETPFYLRRLQGGWQVMAVGSPRLPLRPALRAAALARPQAQREDARRGGGADAGDAARRPLLADRPRPRRPRPRERAAAGPLDGPRRRRSGSAACGFSSSPARRARRPVLPMGEPEVRELLAAAPGGGALNDPSSKHTEPAGPRTAATRRPTPTPGTPTAPASTSSAPWSCRRWSWSRCTASSPARRRGSRRRRRRSPRADREAARRRLPAPRHVRAGGPRRVPRAGGRPPDELRLGREGQGHRAHADRRGDEDRGRARALPTVPGGREPRPRRAGAGGAR